MAFAAETLPLVNTNTNYKTDLPLMSTANNNIVNQIGKISTSVSGKYNLQSYRISNSFREIDLPHLHNVNYVLNYKNVGVIIRIIAIYQTLGTVL